MKKTIFILLAIISTRCIGQINYRYYSKSELQEDLEFLSKKITTIHPLFLDKKELKTWEYKLSNVKEALADSLTISEFYISIAVFVSTIYDEHTGVNMPFDQRIKYSKADGTSFPFFVEIKNNAIYNTFYCGNDSTLFKGKEKLQSINGIESAQIIQKMMKLFGGKSIATKEKAIAQYFRFYLWMFYGFEDDYEIVYKNDQNTIQKITVPGVSSSDFQRNIKRKPKETLKRFDLQINTEQGTAIMKIKTFSDLDGFCAFAQKAFAAIQTQNIENLVIDIRDNGGGRSIVVDSLLNYITNKEYTQYKRIETRISQELKEHYKVKYPDRMEWINQYPINELVSQETKLKKPIAKKHRFNGNLYLLTNNTSFSAAATFAGVFKELKLGKIIGEETGGKIEYFGDYWFMRTPNTKISFYIAPKKFTQFGGDNAENGVLPDFKVKDNGNAIYDQLKQIIEN